MLICIFNQGKLHSRDAGNLWIVLFILSFHVLDFSLYEGTVFLAMKE